jgi:hypothetical protein
VGRPIEVKPGSAVRDRAARAGSEHGGWEGDATAAGDCADHARRVPRGSGAINGMDRQTPRDWVHRYHEEGVDGGALGLAGSA